MDYKETMKKMGFKLDWKTDTISQFSNDDIYIQVIEQEDGYHEFSACPKKCFDRWANSRHINWRLMVENYTEENKCGWTEDKVQKDLEKNITDTIWFCSNLPERMFNNFIKIDL